MAETKMDVAAVMAGETIYTDEQALAIRQFCIDALAAGVPRYRTREQAADVICEWFPGDELALAGLYRAVAQNTDPAAA